MTVTTEPPSDAAAGLDGEVEYWVRTGIRIREPARWMASILGLALSALIGTAPFVDIRSDDLTSASATFAVVGLAFIAITMFLVLRVLIPRATTFEDVQEANLHHPPGVP